MADDPFSCFDNESDDENAHADDVGETLRVRDLDFGVLAFHNGTERALVLFVQQQC